MSFDFIATYDSNMNIQQVKFLNCICNIDWNVTQHVMIKFIHACTQITNSQLQLRPTSRSLIFHYQFSSCDSTSWSNVEHSVAQWSSG